MTQPVDQFALARKRAQQAANTSRQTQKDALDRRFAALGSMDSGARIKLENQVNQQVDEQLSAANEGINAQEQQEMQRRQEIQEGRQYQTKEREASQSFSSGEAAKGRDFATSERLGGQAFSSGESQKGREFQTAERLGGQAFASGEVQKGREFQTSERLGGQAFASGESQKGRDFTQSLEWGQQKFEDTQAGKARDFAQTQQWGQQKFEDTQAQKARDFSQTEAVAGRNFASTQAALDRDQKKSQFDQTLQQQNDQFAKTFGEEFKVNEANILFNRQMMGDESAIPELWKRMNPGQVSPWEQRAAAAANQPQYQPSYDQYFGGP